MQQVNLQYIRLRIDGLRLQKKLVPVSEGNFNLSHLQRDTLLGHAIIDNRNQPAAHEGIARGGIHVVTLDKEVL